MARGPKPDLAEIKPDMTPMIDVVFQLIIFFMTTIKFKQLEGRLETELPKDVGVNSFSLADILEKVEISIEADASRAEGLSLAVNGKPLAGLEALRARLAEFVRNDPATRATLSPGPGVDYENVIQVVDQCVRAGVQDITFAGVAWQA